MVYKIIQFLKLILLLDFSILLALAPYSKMLVKIVLCVALFLGTLLVIAGFLENYQGKKEKNLLKVFFADPLPQNSFGKAILFFLFVSLCSVIISTNFLHSQRIFFERYIPYLLFFMFGYFLAKSKRNAAIIVIVFMAGVSVLGLGAIMDHLRAPAERILSSFGRQVNLSNFLVLAAPLSCVIFLFAKNRVLRFSGFITALLTFPSLIWNGSRAAWLVVPIAILLSCFLKNKKISLVILAVLFIGAYFLAPVYKKRAMTTFDVSSWSRTELYGTAVRIFKAYPFFGAGLGVYEKLMYDERFKPVDGYSPGPKHLHAHSTYLELLSEMGVIGFAAFLWIFFLFFRKIFLNKSLWKNEQNDTTAIIVGLNSSIMALLIFAFASTIIIVGVEDSAVFWFLFGVAASFQSFPESAQS
ncbi:MAG: O-antigen ligase family protein [Candidatus Omnitrophica bacterium]|nr:O-antigen ligase family protein [Candidatus Omnitrophota bacterium]